MKKKNLIIILVLGVVLILISIGVMNLREQTKKENKNLGTTLTDSIIKRMDQKENMLIYVKDDVEFCDLCSVGNDLIAYYEKMYQIKFEVFDKTKATEEDFKKLSKLAKKFKIPIEAPAVLIIQNGELVSVINNLREEDVFKEHLLQWNLIEDKYKDIGHIINFDEFTEFYRSEIPHFVAVYHLLDKSYFMKEALIHLTSQYNFEYNYFHNVYEDGGQIQSLIKDIMKEDYQVPILLVIGNGKIIDYTTETDEASILEILKKNGIIKD